MSAAVPPDDHDLWAKVVKSVTPANRDDVLMTTPKKAPQRKIPAKMQAKPPVAQTKTVKAVAKADIHPADLRSAIPAMRAGIDNASAKRLSKGSFEIDETIDLHGQTEAQAHRTLTHFVNQAARQGARTLLIITGKGVKGQGILRRKVPEWLKDYPLKSLVLAISQASPKDGGGGALYVRLRRQRDIS